MPADGPRAQLALRICFGVLLGAIAAHFGHALGLIGGPDADAFFSDWVYNAVELAATGLCALRVWVVPRQRLAWGMLTASLVLITTGDLTWTVWLNGLEDPPAPNLADAFYYASYGFAYAGVVALLRSGARSFSPALWLDGLVAGLALAAVSAAVAFGPVLEATRGGTFEFAVNLGYPICDLLLLCFVALAFASTGWRPGASWIFIGLSLVLTAVADGGYSYAEAAGDFDMTAVYATLWPAGMVAMAAGAWSRRSAPSTRPEGWLVIAVPGLCTLLSLALLSYSQAFDMPVIAASLALGALLAAAARGALTYGQNVELLRHSRVEALTDALTGLGNRRNLMDDIDIALEHARRGEPRTLVFFDLDGFKQYNDSFGHNAGDSLLARLGHTLQATVAADGSAYRLGGDEFCVLLGDVGDKADGVVTRALASLSEQGEGFSIGASYGVVRLPGDADSATLALQLADERMYADKGSRRTSAPRQARDLLLRILSEREPHLRHHMDEVAALALAVGRHLGLADDELDELGRAAELHDIGKIAVPDSVLHKPGPLDAFEWELMRQHTLVGERILIAAPGLKGVARLVRASHERWDGTGYPDGIAGEDIPLGARVIAICDAYDAMTSDRPYRAGMERPAALAELHRHAGTQFDPTIVAAFAAVGPMLAVPVA